MHVGIFKDIKDNSVFVQERNRTLITRKRQYLWEQHQHSGLPGFINTSHTKLSYDENFERVKKLHFTNDILKAGKFIGGALISEGEHGLTIDEFMKLAMKMKPELDKPHTCDSDERFGRRLLNGINPMVIEKCTSLPENFPVKNDDVNMFLDSGNSLQEEMEVCS